MNETITFFVHLVSVVCNWILMYRDELMLTIAGTLASAFALHICRYIIHKPKEIGELLRTNNFNDVDWGEEVAKSLGIKETMKRNFPEYTDYLLIQYGSSVDANGVLPKDYDFIVLMLGFPKSGKRSLHNKGTRGKYDMVSKANMYDIDIVFRDYLSFLYAATAGMPYENSVIVDGKLINGHKGYFQWLKNITQNHLYDRDFLIRRFEDKIVSERQEYQKCLSQNQKYDIDEYLVIRAGYYYITSLLQLRHIKKFNKVFFQDDVIRLSKVMSFGDDFGDEQIKQQYVTLVDCLKRKVPVKEISKEDIQHLLISIEEM